MSEQHTMAVFAKTDDKPGFEMLPCTEQTLWGTVQKAIFCCEEGELSDAQKDEVTAIVLHLKEAGGIDLEDGWLTLREGLVEVGNFLVEKATAIAEDRDFEDGERYKQYLRAEAAQERYRLLREALIDALGPQADTLITAAVAA